MATYHNIKIKDKTTILVLGILFAVFFVVKYVLFDSKNPTAMFNLQGMIAINQSTNLIAIMAIAIRIVATLYAYKVSEQMNRMIGLWILLGFVAPPVCLIILSLLKQNFPKECRTEAQALVSDYEAAINAQKQSFAQGAITKNELKEQKASIEAQYERELNQLTAQIEAKKLAQYDHFMDNLFSNPSANAENEAQEQSQAQAEPKTNKCPQCKQPLKAFYSKCPNCGKPC